ncbi:MAG: YfbR-like 5'-deoxynucleotidase, partial [Candidatus Ranarchaeia archaeon]
LHDIAETVIGDHDRDLTKYFGKDFRKDKQNAEQLEVEELFNRFSKTTRGFISSWWNELQADTIENTILKVADRIEAGLQALTYIETGYPKENFSCFFNEMGYPGKIEDWPTVKELIHQIRNRYEEL